ncbi:hypothetical protein [Bradyrhizobium shewense]|uniref:hypothetical protein n=1 Tax=Bradyrhizobium shewense TaxID=1761772 RepID=UPI00101AEA1D|nr:hypothetical protein [Bradyrhizobium shewense]
MSDHDGLELVITIVWNAQVRAESRYSAPHDQIPPPNALLGFNGDPCQVDLAPERSVTSGATSIDAARVELLFDELRLPGVKAIWPKLAAQSDKEGWPAARFLAALAGDTIASMTQLLCRRPLQPARLRASAQPSLLHSHGGKRWRSSMHPPLQSRAQTPKWRREQTVNEWC